MVGNVPQNVKKKRTDKLKLVYLEQLVYSKEFFLVLVLYQVTQ